MGEGGIVYENGRDAKRQVGELADALLRGARGTRCAGGSFGGGALHGWRLALYLRGTWRLR